MAGISSKAFNFNNNIVDCGCGNKKGFNGNEIQNKEFSDRSGLEVYDFNARTYDQQVGRFIQIDPITEGGDQEGLTPYQFSLNNPVLYNDPDGKCPLCIIILIGLLLADKPAIAPTGQKTDGPKIDAAYNNSALRTGAAFLPGVGKMIARSMEKDPNAPQGGKFKELETKEGHDRHEIPSRSSSRDGANVKEGDAPAVQIPTSIHKRTSTFGGTKDARLARAREAEMIKQGKAKEVFQEQAKELKALIRESSENLPDGYKPVDYNRAIKQMENYFNKNYPKKSE